MLSRISEFYNQQNKTSALSNKRGNITKKPAASVCVPTATVQAGKSTRVTSPSIVSPREVVNFTTDPTVN